MDIATRFNIHPNQVSEWKKQAIEGLAEVFTGKTERSDVAHEAQVRELHAKIGIGRYTLRHAHNKVSRNIFLLYILGKSLIIITIKLYAVDKVQKSQ